MGGPRSEVPAGGLVLVRAASRRTGFDGFPIVRLSSDYWVSGMAGCAVWVRLWQEAPTTRVALEEDLAPSGPPGAPSSGSTTKSRTPTDVGFKPIIRATH